MEPALRAENLGKRYRLDLARSDGGLFGYRTLRDDLTAMAAAPFRRLRGVRPSGRSADFWALRGVDFEVQPGEVVGVIGRNGAGKSTLLKVVSRVTRPTTGRVEIRGRVGSLLEVGTGFHPELTGRENIFLNGSILGMNRHEIARKFDEITAFAEIEAFLDTPVERYSSGMYVRLAFAVAAHLEPEILIVDEVLAVGDMAFQRKCLGRMREVGRGGSTILFVSHNMPAVEALCSRAILLDGGQVALDGRVSDLIGEYRRRMMGPLVDGSARALGREGGILRGVTLIDAADEPTNFLPLGSSFRLRIAMETPSPIEFPSIGVGIDDSAGQRLLTVHTPLSRASVERLRGHCAVECRIAEFPLAPGDYGIKVAVSSKGEEIDSIEQALRFSVVDADAFDEGRGFQRGVCVAPSQWACPSGTADRPTDGRRRQLDGPRVGLFRGRTFALNTASLGQIIRGIGRRASGRTREVAPDEGGVGYFDTHFRSDPLYRRPYQESFYYFLWAVIVDRVRAAKARRVLEIGCGPGQLAAFLMDSGVDDYTGLDFSPAAVDLARRNAPDGRFEVGDALTTDIYTRFDSDLIICTEALEHIEDDLIVVSRFPVGKRCICSVPNFPYPSHVRHFLDAGEVVDRYGRFFDRLDVITFKSPRSSEDEFHLFDGVRSAFREPPS